MEEKIRLLLAGQVGFPPDLLERDTRLEEELGFDSLDMVEVLAAIENEFGIYLPDAVVSNLRTAGDLLDAVNGMAEEKGEKKRNRF